MSVFDYDKNRDNQKPFHAAGMAENAAKRATEDNQDKYAKQDNTPSGGNEEHFSLNDDRRVKVLSPGALVAKRFFRNRLAVVGLSILIFMFVFSFIGGLLSPYGEDEFFYREDQINKEFAVVTENSDFRYMAKDSNLFGSAVQAQTMLAIQKNSESFSYNGTNYALAQEGSDFYSISSGGKLIGIAYKDVVSSSDGQALSFEFVYTALKSYAALAQEVEEEAEQETAGVSEATGATDDAAEPAEPEEVSEPAVKTFTVDGLTYTIDEDGGVLQGEKEVAYISRYIVQAIMPDIFLSRDFKEKLIDTIAVGGTKFTYTDESLILDDEPEAALDGEEAGIGAMDDALVEEDDTASDATMEYTIERSQNHANWIIRQQQSSRQYDSYSFPSAKHWLGTDKYGMDMLTRLMYGGRVSLMIGFIVVIISAALGVVLGGVDFYPNKKLRSITNVTRTFYDRWDENKYRHYLQLFALDETKKVSQLSSGMRVKYMLALALSHDARLLILDEPTSGLDPVSRDELMELFRGVVKSGERSILFSTHITSDLEKCASHITMIKDGQILCSDTRDGFLARYRAQFGDGQMSLEDILVRVERRSYDSEDFL